MRISDATDTDRSDFDIVNTDDLELLDVSVTTDEIEKYPAINEIYGCHHVNLSGESANCNINEVINILKDEGYKLMDKSNDDARTSPWALLAKHVG